jgi:hypothetical protein
VEVSAEVHQGVDLAAEAAVLAVASAAEDSPEVDLAEAGKKQLYIIQIKKAAICSFFLYSILNVVTQTVKNERVILQKLSV